MNSSLNSKLKHPITHKTFRLIKPLIIGFIIYFSTVNTFLAHAQMDKQFKVVLDAGHGGKDSGTHGYGIQEKDVVLDVALIVGEILKRHKDIKVTYTRVNDKFIGLNERAVIANGQDADLFISIHCNGVKTRSAYGSETFVLGLHRNEDNLKVAMKENQVIELEEDYETKYGGFDPKSPESYIGFSLMQEEYLDQSILLADYVQKNFTSKLSRRNRGVKQAGFLVLRETYMPSVLIELGFLSNKNENNFLKSSQGKLKLADQITKAILNYKNALHFENKVAYKPEIEKNTKTDDRYEATFYVQLAAGKRKLKPSPENFRGLAPISRIKEGQLYKYRFAQSNSHKYIQNKLLEAKEKGYKGAFIISFLGNRKISIEEALKTQIN